MSALSAARAALDARDFDRATQLYQSAFQEAPGPAAYGLAVAALARDDPKVAEDLAGMAIEHGTTEAVVVLADAIGQQGRRKEAEQLAMDAISRFSGSGMLRAVLGEQRVRTGQWDLGAQDFVDALTLDGRVEVVALLHRVVRDLVAAHRAGKVSTERAMSFVNRVEYSAPGNHPHLSKLFASARRALNARSELDLAAPAAIPAPPVPVPPPRGGGPRTGPPPSRSAAPPPPPPARKAVDPANTIRSGSNVPPLVATMKREREMNEELQSDLKGMGLPIWPSENTEPLDTIPRLKPTTLQIDPADFERSRLRLTTGAVDSEILIERALQELLQAAQGKSAAPPTFDLGGLTQLEVALWDGALRQMRSIPDIYYGEQEKQHPGLLALGAFLGECIVRRGDATWSFARKAVESTVETIEGELHPFAVAREWLDADDKDDVHLERLLGEARKLDQLEDRALLRRDRTGGLQGRALAMKIAEQWLSFRMHPLDTAQTDVADVVRPLEVFDSLVIFAIDADFAPPVAAGPEGGARVDGEVAIAYVPGEDVFLCLGSRKHFARAIGVHVAEIEKGSAKEILDLFEKYHRPREKVVRGGDNRAQIARRGGAATLTFTAARSNGERTYRLVHEPASTMPWRLEV